MTRATAARVFFGLTAACVVVGLGIQVPVTANTAGHFATPLDRVLNLFTFFTTVSNIIVGVTCLLLALRPAIDSTAFRVFRLAGVLQIFVTGIVYHVALSDLVEMGKWASIANQFVHTIVPILAVLGWLIFGPRGRITPRIVWFSTLVPIAWLAFTMIRGHFIDWYPYPFLDATAEGYVTVSINIVIVAVMFLAFAAGANLLDPRLPGRTTEH